MHMRGEPGTMQKPQAAYVDVVAEVARHSWRGATATLLVCARRRRLERIVLDPGASVSRKNVQHNLELLRRQRELLALGYPLLVGWSRKSTLGLVTGRDAGHRDAACIAAMRASVAAGSPHRSGSRRRRDGRCTEGLGRRRPVRRSGACALISNDVVAGSVSPPGRQGRKGHSRQCESSTRLLVLGSPCRLAVKSLPLTPRIPLRPRQQ